MHKFLLTAGLSLSSTISLAAPAILDVARADDTYTITGTDFGDFGGEILSWDDFEHHPLESKINTKLDAIGNTWSTIYNYDGLGIRVVDEDSVSGSKSLVVDWSIDEYTIRAFGWAGKPAFDTIYISYWRKMTGDYNPETSNHKQFYLYGTTGNFPQLMPIVEAGGSRWGVYNNVGDADVPYEKRSNINSAGWTWDNTADQFQRWEFFAKLNSPYTESNGIIQVRLNGKLGIDTNDYRTSYVDGKWQDLRIGHMAQGFASTAKALFDDVYIATTPARIEACDTPNYSDCTKKVIQFTPKSAWNPTTISFTPRNLEILKGEKVYLYLIDKNGNTSGSFEIPRINMPES
ncbi:hypothetical protein [Simiduia aestuariiviva]|uniref:Uncharacterized protein n=1 Tax=Simiduia aestuariiviva TaxID=1510459 RepID=A0A839UVK4_9GAMM|nr:hypothetical protein [Simiduia aestuariiviva]MBB3170086.1 hypothetical protein [Simiduia aestuariiviva]